VVRVAVTVVVATVSFYVVERPIRRGTYWRGWRAWVATPAAVLGTVIALVAATNIPAVAANPPTKPPPVSSALSHGSLVKALVVGDSTAETLTIGLTLHAINYDVEPFDGGILGCGFTDGTQVQEKGVDSPTDYRCGGGPPSTQWPDIWKADIAKDRPNVVMILAGRWEVSNRTYEGHWTNIEDPRYAAYVQRSLRYAVQVASSGGASVVLMTAPCYDTGEQPDGQPWPEDSPTRLAIYNGIVRRVAASTPGTSLLNFNAMACPGGHYEEYMDGQQVRLADGIHFTFTGGDVFAPMIWPFVVKLGREQMARSPRSTLGSS
jgi:lysophospholipase L1-like esterase